MKSFWDAIEHSLEERDHKRLGYYGGNIEKLIKRLKLYNNRYVSTVIVDGKIITNNQKENIRNFIDEYKNDDLTNNFYFASRVEPFLILLCEILLVNIIVSYDDKNIYYKNTNCHTKTINFKVTDNILHFLGK